jgi:hypothetical protein
VAALWAGSAPCFRARSNRLGVWRDQAASRRGRARHAAGQGREQRRADAVAIVNGTRPSANLDRAVSRGVLGLETHTNIRSRTLTSSEAGSRAPRTWRGFAASQTFFPSTSSRYLRVADGSTFHILMQKTRPSTAKGRSTIGQYDQLTLAAFPITNDCSALPA